MAFEWNMVMQPYTCDCNGWSAQIIGSDFEGYDWNVFPSKGVELVASGYTESLAEAIQESESLMALMSL